MANKTDKFPYFNWQTGASQSGVTIKIYGDGTPLLIFSGMEGSGESCLHLVNPVIQSLPNDTRYQLILLDYSLETHTSLEDLVTTMATLCDQTIGNHQAVYWGQSFGNILAVMVESKLKRLKKGVFVSPFRELPRLVTHFGSTLLSLTPAFLFKATAKPFGRYMFGPPGDQPDHDFFAALAGMSLDDTVKRIRWMRNRDVSEHFENINNAPAKIWLGEKDRLVDLSKEKRYFTQLSKTNSNYALQMIANSGHVALDTNIVTNTAQDIVKWLSQSHGV